MASPGLPVTRLTTLGHGRLATGHGRGAALVQRGPPGAIPLRPGNRPDLLAGPVDAVLGVEPGTVRRDREVALNPGATLLMDTDGQFECRHDPADSAGSDLLDLVAGGAAVPLPEFCDHVVRGATADTGDDIAVLAVATTR